MGQPIRIVTDSGCDLPDAIAQEASIDIVPLTVRFGDNEFIDRTQLTDQKFWELVAQTSTLPSTAAPSPGAFEAAFRRAADDGCPAVVCITMSSKLSATFQAATIGARAVAGVIPVHLVDSYLVTVGLGTLCLEAAQKAAEGGSAESVVQATEALRGQLHIFGALDTLDHLRKGGRIGAAGAFFGSLLSVKPIIQLKDGVVAAESRQRTRGRALEHLAQLVLERRPVERLAVAHAHALDVDKFLDLISPAVDGANVLVTTMGPVIGTHGGPGVIAVSFADGTGGTDGTGKDGAA